MLTAPLSSLASGPYLRHLGAVNYYLWAGFQRHGAGHERARGKSEYRDTKDIVSPVSSISFFFFRKQQCTSWRSGIFVFNMQRNL
jgi:hypothetical protein